MVDLPRGAVHLIKGAAMQDDATKQTSQSDMTDGAADKAEDLPQKPISDSDAESVKGGAVDGYVYFEVKKQPVASE